MGVFDYKNLGVEGSKALFADAMAITLYSYHNLDNGFAVGYQHHGLGVGLPATLVGALLGGADSQGVIPGIPWNPDSEKAALEALQHAGWTPLSASTLGYVGKVDARGTFFGEKAGYTTAQAEVLGKHLINAAVSAAVESAATGESFEAVLERSAMLALDSSSTCSSAALSASAGVAAVASAVASTPALSVNCG